jgi:hypothetical protein
MQVFRSFRGCCRIRRLHIMENKPFRTLRVQDAGEPERWQTIVKYLLLLAGSLVAMSTAAFFVVSLLYTYAM